MNLPLQEDYNYPKISNPSKVLTFNPLDDHISNLENIIIHLSLFFGFIQLYDLLHDEQKNTEKNYKDESIYNNLVERFL